MRDLLEVVHRWSEAGRPVALATVVRLQGSAPQPPGTTMAVAADGEFWGSVSGGCVENDVALHAVEALESSEARLVSYGIADDEAFEVGLACGGTIQVFIRPAVTEVLEAAGELIAGERLGAVAIVVEGPGRGEAVVDDTGAVVAGSLPAGVDAGASAQAVELMTVEKAAVIEAAGHGVFVAPIAPPPHLVVFGAVHIAQPLTAMARLAGFRVTVADPRPAFATAERFPDADEILVGWPDDLAERLTFDRRTYAVVLNHDARHEDPVLAALLRSEARYVGAMGSRRTHATRLDRLRELGFDDASLDRIHGPVGLDIGAEAPAEVAVSILAEAIRERYRAGAARSLRDRPGPIHAGRDG